MRRVLRAAAAAPIGVVVALSGACGGAAPSCPGGELLDEETEACVPAACGTGEWGLIERDGSTIHVAARGDDGWDGSAEWPYRTIQKGADEAAGGLVVVAAGVYAETVDLGDDHRGIEIAGRCAELVIIDGSEDQENPGIWSTGADITLRQLTVTGADRGVLVGQSGPGTTLTRLESLVLDGNRRTGLLILGGGTIVEAVGLRVLATELDDDGESGRGVQVYQGARLEASELLVERNHDIGVFLYGDGTTASLADGVVRDTLMVDDGRYGFGIGVQGGAALDASGLLLEGNHAVGLFIAQAGSSAAVEDSTIRGTQPRLGGVFGHGIEVLDGGSLVATGLLVDGNRDIGVVVGRPGATAVIDDSVIRGTMPRPDGRRGVGVMVQVGGNLTSTNLLLEANHDIGLAALDDGTTVTLNDVRVTGTRAPPNLPSGIGIAVQVQASLVADGLVVDDNEGPGLWVVVQGEMTATDVELTGNGFAGAAVVGGRLTLDGGVIQATTIHASEGGGVGAFAWDLEGPSYLDLRDLAFSELPGPALYVRGGGRQVLRGCDVSGGSGGPWLPGGVFAAEGVGPWREIDGSGSFAGLLLAGNAFHGGAGDAILLDGSAATLEVDTETGLPNRFEDVVGAPLRAQRCGEEPPAEVLDGSGADPMCREDARPVGPLLEYLLRLVETEAIN